MPGSLGEEQFQNVLLLVGLDSHHSIALPVHACNVHVHGEQGVEITNKLWQGCDLGGAYNCSGAPLITYQL